MNNDGLDDLVFGTQYSEVRIYFNDGDGSVTINKRLPCPLYENRPTADLVDFNGDGLLDMALSSHYYNKSNKLLPIYIVFNEGTKEEPLFVVENSEELAINGTVPKFERCNILFTDINNDSKKDLFFSSSTSTGEVELKYSLNVSENDSIILGPIHNLEHNGEPISILQTKNSSDNTSLYQLLTHYGDKVHLACYDTNNDGIKEFYVNSKKPNAGWFRFYSEDSENLISDNIANNTLSESVTLKDNKIVICNSVPVTEVCVFTLRGKLIKTEKLYSVGHKEIHVNGVSAGAYLITLRSDRYNRTYKVVNMK